MFCGLYFYTKLTKGQTNWILYCDEKKWIKLLVKDDTPFIICTFSLWVKKQYCDGTKIDEISCEITGEQDSGSIFSDYIRLIFCLLNHLSCPFAFSREVWTIYSQMNWPKMSIMYSVFQDFLNGPVKDCVSQSYTDRFKTKRWFITKNANVAKLDCFIYCNP